MLNPVATGWSRLVSHNGCRLLTIGVCKKIKLGGGDDTAPSRPDDFHGSGPATAPPIQLLIALMTNSNTDVAIVTAPTVARRLSGPQPVAARYVYTRRGMPFSPRMCIGKNVTFTPMTNSQKCHLPSVSPSIRPVIFGNQ